MTSMLAIIISKTFPFSEHLTESNVPYEFIDIDISKFNEDKLKLKIIRYIDMTKKQSHSP